jgi:hypothetical protein
LNKVNSSDTVENYFQKCHLHNYQCTYIWHSRIYPKLLYSFNLIIKTCYKRGKLTLPKLPFPIARKIWKLSKFTVTKKNEKQLKYLHTGKNIGSGRIKRYIINGERHNKKGSYLPSFYHVLLYECPNEIIFSSCHF